MIQDDLKLDFQIAYLETDSVCLTKASPHTKTVQNVNEQDRGPHPHPESPEQSMGPGTATFIVNSTTHKRLKMPANHLKLQPDITQNF